MEFSGEVLETAVNRKSVLAVLAERPRHRRELQETCGFSKATCHRILRSFDEKGLLGRTERGYELTGLGRVVEKQVGEFERDVRTAYRLQPLLEAFDSAPVDFDLGPFADATITRPQPDDPSPPVHRYLELFREARSIRTLARKSFAPPLYIEEIFEAAFAGDSNGGIAIYPKSVVETRYAEYPEIHRKVADEGIPIRTALGLRRVPRLGAGLRDLRGDRVRRGQRRDGRHRTSLSLAVCDWSTDTRSLNPDQRDRTVHRFRTDYRGPDGSPGRVRDQASLRS